MAPPFAQKTTKAQQQQIEASQARTSGASIGRDLDREITRKTFFDNRPDISDDRLDRRRKQAQELKDFKDTLKIAEGTTNLYQASKPVFDTDSSSPTFGQYVRTTIADKEMELANKYGPTFREIASDMGYAIGSMTKGAIEKGVGLTAILKGVSDKFSSNANKNYNNLNDVSKEIADNPTKYPLTSSGLNSLQALNNNERLALEAQRDAQKFSFAGDASGSLGVDTNRLDGFVNEPIDTFGTAGPTVDMRSPTIEEMRTMPITQSGIFPAEEVKEAAIDRFSQEYLDEQKRLLDELNIMPTVKELQPEEKSELGILDLLNPFDEVPIQMGINELINPEQQDIKKFKEEMNQGSLSKDDGTQVTAYNNPGNLQFAGQQGAIEGQTYGNNFAVFPNAEAGISALKNDLLAKVNRSNKVEDIIGQYAAGDPNVENYIDFVTSRVGPTVDQNELDDLRNAVIRFENKPDIAERYLALVADGGLMDKKMYGGIIASKG